MVEFPILSNKIFFQKLYLCPNQIHGQNQSLFPSILYGEGHKDYTILNLCLSSVPFPKDQFHLILA